MHRCGHALGAEAVSCKRKCALRSPVRLRRLRGLVAAAARATQLPCHSETVMLREAHPHHQLRFRAHGSAESGWLAVVKTTCTSVPRLYEPAESDTGVTGP